MLGHQGQPYPTPGKSFFDPDNIPPSLWFRWRVFDRLYITVFLRSFRAYFLIITFWQLAWIGSCLVNAFERVLEELLELLTFESFDSWQQEILCFAWLRSCFTSKLVSGRITLQTCREQTLHSEEKRWVISKNATLVFVFKKTELWRTTLWSTFTSHARSRVCFGSVRVKP